MNPRPGDFEGVAGMGFFSHLLGRDYDYEDDGELEEGSGSLPELHSGMSLTVETPEGQELLVGRLTGYAAGDTSLTLERLPGGLSFKTRDMGTSVMIRGFDEQMNQFILKGTVQESTRLVCRVKDLKVRPISEHRQNFRLHVNGPAVLYYPTDETRSNPE